MPVTSSKLRRLVRSKHPYVEHNLDTVVNIIRHSMQNAAAFEVAAQQLKEGHSATVSNIVTSCHSVNIVTAAVLYLHFPVLTIKHQYYCYDYDLIITRKNIHKLLMCKFIVSYLHKFYNYLFYLYAILQKKYWYQFALAFILLMCVEMFGWSYIGISNMSSIIVERGGS